MEIDDALQFFKEEKTSDAVYTVYLKKVRYHTPVEDGSDDDEDRKAHLQWRLEEVHVIKQGSLGRLVEALSSGSGDIDSTYVNTFLVTFRSFSTPHDVMQLIFKRFRALGEDRKMKQHEKEGHYKTIRTVLSVWLDSYPDDFNEPPDFPTLTLLIEQAGTLLPDSDLKHRARLRFTEFLQQDEPQGPIEVEDVSLSVDLPALSVLDEAALFMGSSYMAHPLQFINIPPKTFAEQLTYIDSELFKKVIPHHCLGSIWSRRGKKHGSSNAPSVYATVNQFNSVSYRVIATILKNPHLSGADRAVVIEKWIDIAQECRVLKNFSSLKAIISGLQSNAVYRLSSVWALLDREKMDLFEELSEIFSDDNNQMMAREVLNREGTAKFADPETCNTIRGHKRNRSWGFGTIKSRKSVIFDVPSTVQGTVPYLGTFLTDLTMIDTAIKDHTDDGLINFDKKRKEFEQLAQIRLLQSAAQLYNMRPDQAFFEWFHSIRTYDDNESYELSCEIESTNHSTPKDVKGHRRKSSLGFFSPRRPAQSLENLHVSDPPTLYTSDDNNSVLSQPEPVTPISGPRPNLKHSVSVGSLRSMESADISVSPWRSPETIVAKVFLETADNHTTNFYKSILLANSDHTRNVVHAILAKYGLEDQVDHYVLFQLLDRGRELALPEKGNVFYAISTSVKEVQFVMRKKSDIERLKSRHLKSKSRRKKLTL